MHLSNRVKRGITEFFQAETTDWWVEITTVEPCCVYYFGPFQTSTEAKADHFAYLEDLQKERAQGISVEIKRCQPTELTIFDDGS